MVIPAQGEEGAAASSQEEWAEKARSAGGKVATEARRAGQAAAQSVRDAGGAMRGATGKAAQPARTLLGSFLVGLGSLLLADELGLLDWPVWASLATLWPVVLIAMGASLMWNGLKRERA